MPFKNIFLKSTAAAMVALLFISFSTEKIPARLQAKIDAAVKEAYGVETFKMEQIPVPEQVNAQVKADFGPEHFFRLNAKNTSLGYLYLGVAPSMKSTFDYIIMLEPDLSIKKSKILIYREDFGRQIGSQRWLKQFIGLSPDDSVVYGEDVDAISGATISAKSMTAAVTRVLKGLRVLRAEGIVK